MLMRAIVGFVTLLPVVCGLLCFAQEPTFSGTWKFNSQKSIGPAPVCLTNGVLKIPVAIYTGPGSGTSQRTSSGANAAPSPTAKCASGVYKFDTSPDGRTLTMTQPQRKGNFKAVFDRQ